MSTTTFIESKKFRNHVSETRVTVEKTAATIADLNQNARWFQTVGSEVVSVERVKVSRESVAYQSTPYTEEGFEVTFKCGARGYVNDRKEFPELDALVVGTEGYLHGLAVWRKHRWIVGCPTPWFRAQMGRRARLSPERAPRCCAAELYARAAGKPWGIG